MMAELGDEELTGVAPKSMEESSRILEPFGFWTDERGIKHKGVIPVEYRKVRNPTPKHNTFKNDYQGARTSNQRFN